MEESTGSESDIEADSGDDNGSVIETHTTTVTLPEYQSENIITVETLEQNPETSGESEQTVVVIPVITWESVPAYDSDTQGEYIFTPVLPEAYCVGQEAALPEITVTVEQTGVKQRRTLARAAAADGAHQDHTGWTELRSNSKTLTGGNYYLNADMDAAITIQSGATVNLCLNGHTLHSSGYTYDEMVTVESGATLNVYDCAGNGTIGRIGAGGGSKAGIRTDGNVNVYGGTISGRKDGIHTTGTVEVNLYGGIVYGEDSNGIYLDSGTRLLIDGGEVRNKLTGLNNNATAAVFMAQGSSAELRSGTVFAEETSSNAYNNRTMWILPDCTFTMSGGTIDCAGERSRFAMISAPSSTEVTGGAALVEITGGTINCGWGVRAGVMIVDDTEIRGSIAVYSDGGTLKIKGGQPIGSALGADEPDIVIFHRRGSTEFRFDRIELTEPLTNADRYTIQLSEVYASSSNPITVTRGFSTHMPGKEPSDCFTYLKTGDRYDYKMVLSGGEVTLLPYVMTFDANGGTTDVEKGDITGGQYLRSLPDPTRDGYSFDGWYTEAAGGTEVTIDAMPHEDITVYAHWTPVTYDITYDLAGGALPAGKTNPVTYNIESAAFTLHNPERTGYTFTGWSGTGLLGSASKSVTVAKGSTGERTYTANWKANTYKVTLNGNGGSGTALTGYTYGTGVTLPVNWTRTGYTFEGWYTSANFTGTPVASITAADTGNKVYYAKWNPKQYTVTFDDQGATGGDDTASMQVTYDSAYGTLPRPEKDGYAFQGWYTQADGKGSQIVSTTKVTTDGDHVLYACWKDSTAPEAPVLSDGVTLPADWTNTQRVIPLVLTDNVGVTKLWVKVDDGDFAPVDGFDGGGVSVQYSYTVSEGNHTYTFKAADAAGNESAASVFTVKLDTAKPVIGSLSYENKATTLWQWIIGKKNMIIHVPVSDDGSGVTQIRYIMTPADADGSYEESRKEEKTAAVVDGQAEITFAQDEVYPGFRGRIIITCTDLAGNAADSVTVGMTEGAEGVLVEDTAPVITAMADRMPSDTTAAQPGGTAIAENYYETAPALLITVSDDTVNQIVAGIASITYQVGDNTVKSVAVENDTMHTRIRFTIPASEIPGGMTVIRVTARDHAGNEAAEAYTVKVKGPERKPAAVIDYRTEKLTDLIPNAKYSINGVLYTADELGCVTVEEAWMGAALGIVKCGNGIESMDSEAQSLPIPVRPQTPSPTAQDETGPNRKDGSLTGLTGNTTYEISVDGGKTWESRTADTDGRITGLAPGSYIVRVAATDLSFASRASEPAAEIKAYRIRILFMANGEEYTSIYTSYGESITQIPEVPARKDAGEQLYEGVWCDAQGNPVSFANIEADMTVYAVYTALYTVTLQSGTGYTLAAESDSLSPVKEGGSYSFTFALHKGYRTNARFAVKVNDAAVETTEDGSYIIEEIRENKVVTVEGVVKKTSGGKPGGGSSSEDGSQPGGGNPSGDSGQPGGGNPSGDSGQPGGGNPSGDSSQPGGGNPSGDSGKPDDDNSPDGKEPPEGGTPLTGTRPPKTGTPPVDRTSADQSGSDGTAPSDTDSGDPSRDADGVTDGTAPHEEEQGTTPADMELSADGENVQTVSAAIDGDRIVLSDENIAGGGNVATGNVNGMPGTSTVLELGDGAVVVKVICTEKECSAGVQDTVAVANAVLTQTHMELVSNGEVIEIRIDVKDISSQVPKQDQEVIENGIEACHEEIPGLKLGMYVDISMFIRSGQEEWQAIAETAEPVAAVIGIPSGLQEDGREYYIIRAHAGEYTLMQDTDDTPDTITISTDKFSSYAIAWQESGNAGSRCGLCHICPTFLGICCFVWLAVIAAAVLAVWLIVLRKRKEAGGEA